MESCVYCKKELPAKKRKYCSELCRYRWISIKNETPGKFKIAQFLRISRAGKRQRLGKIGVRFN